MKSELAMKLDFATAYMTFQMAFFNNKKNPDNYSVYKSFFFLYKIRTFYIVNDNKWI